MHHQIDQNNIRSQLQITRKLKELEVIENHTWRNNQSPKLISVSFVFIYKSSRGCMEEKEMGGDNNN